LSLIHSLQQFQPGLEGLRETVLLYGLAEHGQNKRMQLRFLGLKEKWGE